MLQVNGLLLVMIHSHQLVELRRDFQRRLAPCVALKNEQTSCHQAIAESLSELKVRLLDVWQIVIIIIVGIGTEM